MLFHEAPHKLRATLADLRDAFGPDRRLSLCRELTKLHEETLRMTLGEAAAYYEVTEPKGEFVLVLEGAPQREKAGISLEEAASIDGCNRYQTFFYVVFPLLKPITMTSIVLAFLASWNDFIISMIICQKLDRRTLPLMQFYFFGEYSANVNVAFAASLIAMLPAVIIYFCAQKYIVAGMTAGAVKS